VASFPGPELVIERGGRGLLAERAQRGDFELVERDLLVDRVETRRKELGEVVEMARIADLDAHVTADLRKRLRPIRLPSTPAIE
jgi:hypothetical protein